jgi:hypothetical protein
MICRPPHIRRENRYHGVAAQTSRARSSQAMMIHVLVPKMRQALTFLATIGNHHRAMRTLAVISILALLTISGAAITDQMMTGDRQTARGTN